DLHYAEVVTYNPREVTQTSSPNSLIYFNTLINNEHYKRLLKQEINTWREHITMGVRELLGYGASDKSHRKEKTKGIKDIQQEKRKGRRVGAEGSIDMDVDSEQPAENPATSQPESKGLGQTKVWHKTLGKLDPELRVTAWFACNACQFLEPRYRRRGVFDFFGMCNHQCQRPDLKKKDPLLWSITNFSRALHAIETTKAMLDILCLDEEDPETKTACFDGLWLCRNCPETMKAMQWEDLRLEKISMGKAMDREQLRAEDKRPFTVSKLLLNKKEAGKKKLFCVHCMPSSEALLRAKFQGPGQMSQKGAPKAMDIHGIRQHLKVKLKLAKRQGIVLNMCVGVEFNLSTSDPPDKTVDSTQEAGSPYGNWNPDFGELENLGIGHVVQEHIVNSASRVNMLQTIIATIKHEQDEILIYIAKCTAHPGDILSLTYTCQHLHKLFAHEESRSIWKHARDHIMLIRRLDIIDRTSNPKNSHLANDVCARWINRPIPPPFPGQTEMCLAQLLFGQKSCPYCKKEHNDIPRHPVLGVTLCEVSLHPLPSLPLMKLPNLPQHRIVGEIMRPYSTIPLVEFFTELGSPNHKELLEGEIITWQKQATVGARRLLGYSEGSESHSSMKNKAAKKTRREKGIIKHIYGKSRINRDSGSKHSVQNRAEKRLDSEASSQLTVWRKAFGKLDPEIRVTAWFICNVCRSLEPRARRRGVLDFLDMCAHQCQRPNCSTKNPIPWAITNFTLALHAVDTTRAMLEILGLNEEDPKTKTKCFAGLWICQNCPETMKAMQWEDLIRHCNRHPIQRLEKISVDDAIDREQARGEGRRLFTVSQLLSNKREGNKKRLLCAQCLPTSEALCRAKSRVSEQTNENGLPKAMDIHGLRQHLKVKFVGFVMVL
ncbi:7820_t:CDS:2, partial [Acaulospora colombiana]